MSLQENIRKILREETSSPGGKKYRPGRFVYHKSDTKNRTDILKYGLIPSIGECYKEYSSQYSKGDCVPAIFATDSTNPEEWFETERDDDIWRIDTEISNVDWRVDKHFKDMRHPEFGRYRHIVTLQEVIPESLKLVHKGTGKYIYESVINEGIDLPSKFLRRVHVFRDDILNTDAVLNPFEYHSFNHFKS